MASIALPLPRECITENAVRRFWGKVNKSGPSASGELGACWIWMATVNNQGYGQFYLGAKNRLAHRVAYLIQNGELDPELSVDHICRTRLCQRGSHLRLMSAVDNTLIGNSPAAKNARKTHCFNGHLFTESTTVYQKVGDRITRHCRVCRIGILTAYKHVTELPRPSAAQLQDDINSGMSWIKIGLKYGVSRKKARDWAVQLGVFKRSRQKGENI